MASFVRFSARLPVSGGLPSLFVVMVCHVVPHGQTDRQTDRQTVMAATAAITPSSEMGYGCGKELARGSFLFLESQRTDRRLECQQPRGVAALNDTIRTRQRTQPPTSVDRTKAIQQIYIVDTMPSQPIRLQVSLSAAGLKNIAGRLNVSDPFAMLSVRGENKDDKGVIVGKTNV